MKFVAVVVLAREQLDLLYFLCNTPQYGWIKEKSIKCKYLFYLLQQCILLVEKLCCFSSNVMHCPCYLFSMEDRTFRILDL